MKPIIENATIIQKNGSRQIYDAIRITKKGIYTGRIIIKTEESKEFEGSGFIPRSQIQKITICNNEGKLRDIDLKKIWEEKMERKGDWQNCYLFIVLPLVIYLAATPFLRIERKKFM